MKDRSVIPLSAETDTTAYHLVPNPSGLFIDGIAYDGAEVIRRLQRWEQAAGMRRAERYKSMLENAEGYS